MAARLHCASMWLHCASLALLFTASVAFQDYVPTPEQVLENNVAVATRNNVLDLINRNRILLIMCYVPWDRDYQAKIKDYEKLANAIYKATPDVSLAKLDMAADIGAADEIEVKPENGLQFIFYRQGKSYNFADYTDIKELSKKLKVIAAPTWRPPETPLLINRVKEMHRKDFVNDLPDKYFSTVLFYKPESLASQRLLYDFELAVNSLKVLNGIKQSFHKFDAQDKSETMAKYGVKTLPALKFFRNGKVYDYNGPLVNPKEMKKYIEFHMEKPFTSLADAKELDAYLKKSADRATVVGFFASLTLSAFPHFVEAALNLRDQYNFVLMSTPVVSNSDGETKQAEGWTMAVFLPKRQHTPDDEKKSVLQYEGADYKMIVDFIKWKATPLAGERTRKNLATTYSLRPLVVVYAKVNWTKSHRKETEYLRDKVASAAKDHKDTLFSFSDSTAFAHEVQRFGFDMDPKYDLHVGILGANGEYYPRWDTVHMSAKMIGDFVKQYKDGDVKPFYRSKAASPQNTAALQLTGETFKSQILEGTSDALILMYHPLAKHWRLAQSVLNDFAQDPGYKRQKVVFGELDVSINDIPVSFELPTYPVIYFIPKNHKRKPTKITGDILGEYGIRQFLKEQLEKLAPNAEAQSPRPVAEKPKNVKTEL
ncbi:putative Protein disulfide-isomerase A4 [Hypsibius exemplaris]|uniref:Thioredoxin domain-containing protein n=1 Tax=Hypsibius exemplaris TaxID=2072580 RepID=A0A1W0WMM5_HYPEX|nr:putative Protein disulfide-isomerase A4 [Hypsibius exemplaris]